LGDGRPGALRGSVAAGAPEPAKPAPTPYGVKAAAPVATPIITAVTPIMASDASDSPAPTVEILDGPSPPGVLDSPRKGKGKGDDDSDRRASKGKGGKGKGDDDSDHKRGKGKGDDHDKDDKDGKGKGKDHKDHHKGKDHKDHHKGKGKGSAVWEFEGDHGWKSFADDCQSYIEKKWKEYDGGKGQAMIKVKTHGQEISVDFKRMTQKNKDKIRQIRRRDSD